MRDSPSQMATHVTVLQPAHQHLSCLFWKKKFFRKYEPWKVDVGGR
jgi:hypothetical protein